MNSNIFGEHNLKEIGLLVQNRGFLYDALLKKGTQLFPPAKKNDQNDDGNDENGQTEDN